MVPVEITEYGEIIEIGTEVTEDFQPDDIQERQNLSYLRIFSPIIPTWLFEDD